MNDEKTFKASNGLVISEIDECDYMVTSPSGVEINIDPWQSMALHEYFQHQRDRQLGRVRWPENPDYVIYREEEHDDEDGRCVRVLHEPSAIAEKVWERWPASDSDDREVAARWYFEEGPGKKPERPWEEAKAGEVWRLTVDGLEGNHVKKLTTFSGGAYKVTPDYAGITAGRKLVNADGSMTND